MPKLLNKSKGGISLVGFVLLLGLWLYPPTLGHTSNLPSVTMPLLDMQIPAPVDTLKVDSLLHQMEQERIKLIRNKLILQDQQDTIIKYNL